MRSIKARFNKFLNEQPISSYIAFAEAVKKQRFSRDSIARNWWNLVDIEDYCKSDKNTLINQLYLLSNPLEEHEIEHKQPSESIEFHSLSM